MKYLVIGADVILSAFAAKSGASHRLLRAVEAVDVTFLWRPQMKDPDDELVLEAAVNGNADAIITHDVRTFAAHGAIFGIKVTTPTDYLKELAL